MNRSLGYIRINLLASLVLRMSPAYTIGPEAYYKIFFHAAKHPHKSVNGVLLGTQDPQHPGSAVEIADAVPLLHHWTSLSPMMEIGLDLVRSFAFDLQYHETQPIFTIQGIAVRRLCWNEGCWLLPSMRTIG